MSTPSPQTISIALLRRYASLYPQVVEKVYTAKIKDAKKLKAALDNDRWRFDELPRSVKKASGKGLSKGELERLVQWKITHGVNRPFLPGMIRKNDASAVQTETSAAFTLLGTLTTSTIPPNNALEITLSALTKACTLTGVGPATGTLLLSIYDPVHVPFFQDEMYAWFFPGQAKLKYDKKEYVELFKSVGNLLGRLGDGVHAVEVEKAAFVIGHLAVLDEAEREGLGEVELEDITTSGVAEEPGTIADTTQPAKKESSKRPGTADGSTAQSGTQRKSKRAKT